MYGSCLYHQITTAKLPSEEGQVIPWKGVTPQYLHFAKPSLLMYAPYTNNISDATDLFNTKEVKRGLRLDYALALHTPFFMNVLPLTGLSLAQIPLDWH